MSPLFRVLAGFTLAVMVGLCLMMAGCGGKSPIPDAGAQSISDVVSWVNPTTRTDGSALTNLASIRIQWGPKGGPYSAGQQSVAAPGTTASIPRVNTPGTVCYVLTAVDAAGLTSSPTAEVCKTIQAPPSAPTSVTVS